MKFICFSPVDLFYFNFIIRPAKENKGEEKQVWEEKKVFLPLQRKEI